MLHKRITQYRKGFEPDPIIGCTVLTEPFFFDESDWIPMPRDWSPNIVVGKRYDPNEAIGMEIWTHVSKRLQSQDLSETKAVEVSEEPERYGSLYLAMGRIGQGAFRVLVTDAYNRRCAISGERTLPVLQASHIKPYVESGPNKISNGLLLRSDLHILFDKGYVTITNDYRVEVSKRIKAEFENGRDYYTFHGQKLTVLPRRENEKPSIEFIEWHNQHVYAS
jgi:putative restriction endonuclease